MNGPTRRDPYRVAFEQAQSHLRQLSFELDTLDHRHAALLSVTTALEAMIAPRAGQNANQASSTAAATASASVAASKTSVTPAIEPLTQTYVHRDLPNAIQRRIDLALGSK